MYLLPLSFSLLTSLPFPFPSPLALALAPLRPLHGGATPDGPIDNCSTEHGDPTEGFECSLTGWLCLHPSDDGGGDSDGPRDSNGTAVDGAVLCDDQPWPAAGCWCDPGTCCFTTPNHIAYCTKDVCGIDAAARRGLELGAVLGGGGLLGA